MPAGAKPTHISGEGWESSWPLHMGRYAWILAAVWTASIAGSLGVSLYADSRESIEVARTAAEFSVAQDILFRRRMARDAAMSGAPSQDGSIGSRQPFHSAIPRDMQVPVFMEPSSSQLSSEGEESKTRLVSLNPMNPANAPDPWETEGLRAFEQGAQVVSRLEGVGNSSHLRIMLPFVTEKTCLACHEAQGYKEGEVRGGVSISVPMALFRAATSPMLVKVAITYGILWIFGLAGIWAGAGHLRREFSQRMQVEEALRESVRQAGQARERSLAVQATARLIQGLAHEVRNPLFAIRVNAAALEKIASLPPDTARNIGFVKEHVARLDFIMRDLMELAQAPSKEERTECRLKEAVDAAVSEIVNQNPDASGRITVEVPESPCTFQCIPERLQRALAFLIENALQNSPPQGRVWVRASRSDGNALLEVVDEGAGIPETVREHLFEPFVTSHIGRRGLGLALARHYLESTGCTLEAANNEPPPGATFAITIPMGEEEGHIHGIPP